MIGIITPLISSVPIQNTAKMNVAQLEAKLEEINRIIKDGGGDKQYTFKTYLEDAWKICMDDTDKHLKVADRPARKGK